MHAWERERKSLYGQIKSLEGQMKNLEGENISLEGVNKSLEGQIKNLEAWQIYQETCAELDSMIWGRPFLLGTIGELF
jgi:hypothetical protein